MFFYHYHLLCSTLNIKFTPFIVTLVCFCSLQKVSKTRFPLTSVVVYKSLSYWWHLINERHFIMAPYNCSSLVSLHAYIKDFESFYKFVNMHPYVLTHIQSM